MSRLAISMLISAVFDTANIVMNGRMSSIGSPGAPALTTSTSGVSLSSSFPIGTSATATIETSTYTMPAMVNPESRILGNVLIGSLVSSAMFTESSNPTIAKKASEVAAVTARKVFLSSTVSNATMREKSTSPPPPVNAHKPTRITTSRPVISTMVRTTLSLTLSPTPR